MLQATPNIRIPEAELAERFVRAGGPGGQNVNKLATAVQLRFDVTGSACLPKAVRQRLLTLAAGRINRDGELVIDARRFRSQERNRADARERLARWIARAAAPPAKRRKPTRPSRAARQRRLDRKKQQGRRKAMRRPPGTD